MGKKVRRYFRSFDNIFSLNYDNNVENICGEEVYHLHGDFSVPADSENPQTIQGFYRRSMGKCVVIPGFEHCFCNALLNFSGELKYQQAERNRVFSQFVSQLKEKKHNGDPDFDKLLDIVQEQFPEVASWIKTSLSHPDLMPCTDYHFSDFQSLSGELHILGISPQNDSHIFRCIDNSSIEKVVFYHYGDAPKTIPITRKVEFKSVTELWHDLNADWPHFNCNPRIPDNEQVRKFIDVLNALSFDTITMEEMVEELKSIPPFVSDPLCEEAVQLMKRQEQAGPVKSEDEQERQFRAVSQIALREGILPSAFLMLLLNYKNAHESN